MRGDPRASTRDGLTVWSSLDYSGVARRVIGAFKDGGRTDARTALAEPLEAAVLAALGPGLESGVHLVTVPASPQARRARGYHPVELLLSGAGLASTPVLRQHGRVHDQVGLSRDERVANKLGSLEARRRLDGFRCVLVDDIVTTGATILEARRAVLEAGGEVLGMATLAQTRRRLPDTRRSPKTD